MYRLINENIELILDRIDSAKDIQPYIWLLERLRNCDVRTDAAFQAEYRRYWRMNAARLSDDFYKAYFALLEEFKVDHAGGLEAVLRRLHEVPSDAKNTHKLHFSFATKLVHMAIPTMPIYDKMVADFFFLPEIKGKSLKDRLAQCKAIFGFLGLEYYRVIDEKHLLDVPIAEFRKRFNVPDTYTDVKVVDTLIWRFVTLLRDGAIVRGDVVYSGQDAGGGR